MSSNKPICLSSSSFLSFLITALVIFLINTSVCASNGGNESDYLALLSFKSMITHDPYGALSSWNNSVHFCDWSGVSCGKRHRRVTAVIMKSQGLAGSLSPHVGNLSFLRVLYLLNNSFQGTIPHELSRLSRLRELSLAYNELSGVIPVNISHCYNLQKISVAHNMLVGSIPKEISSLSKLTFFSVQYNNVTGGISPLLGNMTSMEVFAIVNNPLGGSIPDTLGNWKSLKEFYSASCNLYGIIPHSIYNLSLLTIFSSSRNNLSGSFLPSSTNAMLPNLQYLQLNDNQLTGFLPASLSNCSKLENLVMSHNNFSGKLTIDFSKLGVISNILLAANFFGSGEDDEMKFIDQLENSSRLLILDLSECIFQGALPKSIGNLSKQLHVLNFEYNLLYGNLPSSIGNLVSLTVLALGYNQITGKIPSTIGKLQNLQFLSVYENQFSGLIPDAIGNLTLLTKLSLGVNRFEGKLPSSLGNFRQLLSLDLSNNNLVGRIPKQLLQLSSLTILLDLSQNNLHGSLPAQIKDLKMLTTLDLSHNKLSGGIPSGLGGCTSLSSLSLQQNLFQGMIPPSLSSLRGMVTLDLSQNNFSGQLPQFLEHFSSLKYLNLSFNDFEGEIPILGVFSNTSSFSILGNNRLCGGAVELALPKCKETEKHKKKFPWFAAVILIAFALFTVSCLVYAWCKKKRRDQQTQSSMNEQFLKVSYHQLFKATNGFSEANLIGEGGFSSVYKGILEDDDRVVAVKVIHLQNRGALKSFTRECEVLRGIRHRNLLKIVTSCSSIDFQGNDFKALVYEFMPNGNLHDWLHSSANTSRLNLLQRLNILIDVATALDYLHNHSATTIIHGDLKPHNILLDQDMVVRVGDFGLARFYGSSSNQNSSTGIRGTVGYVAPEYGIGSEMTSSGDVYSFGILLLEVITGKQPTDKIFNEDLSLHKFAHMALPDHVTDVIDDNLHENPIAMQRLAGDARNIDECLASIVEIGVSCSLVSPLQRMTIENVIHELHRVQHMLQNT